MFSRAWALQAAARLPPRIRDCFRAMRTRRVGRRGWRAGGPLHGGKRSSTLRSENFRFDLIQMTRRVLFQGIEAGDIQGLLRNNGLGGCNSSLGIPEGNAQ